MAQPRQFFVAANQFTAQLSDKVRAAIIGNAGTLVVFRVGSDDAQLLTHEFLPMQPAALADQEPFTAWLRRGIGQDRIFVEPPLYAARGTGAAIREQSRQRFGRPTAALDRC